MTKKRQPRGPYTVPGLFEIWILQPFHLCYTCTYNYTHTDVQTVASLHNQIRAE